MARRPHIVIFNPDQFRADALGHLGNPAAVTPNLDRFAATEGVSFSRAFCQSPICTPSRCSFMSGWYPHVRGHRTMFHMMHGDEPVLLRTLKDEGYYVWWGGKNDLIPAAAPVGDYCTMRYLPPGLLRPDLHGDQSWRGLKDSDSYFSFYAGRLDKGGQEFYQDLDWANVMGAIDSIRRAPRDRPFCLYLALNHPHPPYGVEEPWYGAISRHGLPPRLPTPAGWQGKPSMLRGIHEHSGLQGWNEEQWSELRATYLGMCARVDHFFGLLVEALKETGVYDETSLFFLSDHGDFTGDYGLVEKTPNTFEDCLTRVPFLIKPPAWVPTKPRVSEALVELVDFPATLEALVDMTSGHTHFGRSLLPLIAGETDEHREAVFCEGGRLHGETHCMERESGEIPPIADLYLPRLSLQWEEGPEHGKAVMVRTKEYKYVRRLYEGDELYDLRDDPGELRNRLDDPRLAGVLAGLKERLLTFYLETGDAVPHKTDRRW